MGEASRRWRETASGFGLNQWQSVEKLQSSAVVGYQLRTCNTQSFTEVLVAVI